MINNKIKKIKIGDTEYTFQMTNRTILKIDEMSGNYGTVTEGLINNKQLYKNSVIVMACSCLEKDWGIDELIDELTVSQINGELVNFALDLYFNYLGLDLNKLTENNTDNEKK